MELDLVGCLNLAVGLVVLNRGEVVLYFVAGKETSKPLVNELGSVISYHVIQYLETSEDVDVSSYELPTWTVVMVDRGSTSTHLVK